LSAPASSHRLSYSDYDIERAAAKLTLQPEALRARCRRAAVREGREIVAHLGGGVVAFKFGRSWRVRFPRKH
jgi:hypothetical protein